MILGLVAATSAAQPETCPDATTVGLDGSRWEVEPASEILPKARAGERESVKVSVAEAAAISLYARLSPRLTPLEADQLWREIGRDKASIVDLSRGRTLVCAWAFVPRERLTPTLSPVAIEDLFRMAAAGIHDAVGVESVMLAPAVTSVGCPVGSLGRAFNSRLKSELSRLGTTFPKDEASARWEVLPQLDAEDASGATVTIQLFPVKSSLSVPMPAGAFTFPPGELVDDYQAAVAEARLPCTQNGELRLDASGRRPGAGGLTVNARANRSLDSLVSGDKVSLTITTNTPARVQVYSVSPDGTGWLSMKRADVGGRWVTPDQPWTGFDLTMVATNPPRTEQLLVVAVPEGTPFGATSGWSGFCAVPGRVTDDLFPETSAMVMQRMSIEAPEDTATSPALPTVPACGVNP